MTVYHHPIYRGYRLFEAGGRFVINDSIFPHPQDRLKFVHNRQFENNEVKHCALLGTGSGVECHILVQDEVAHLVNISYKMYGDHSKFIFSSPLYDDN
jgi:hypothetical protein